MIPIPGGMWSNRNSPLLPMGIKWYSNSVRQFAAVSYKLISLWPNVPRYLYNWHENLCPHKTCTWMFLAALFVMVSNWGQPRYPSIGEWINKSWYIYILEYDSVIVRNELPSRHGNTQMNLKYIFGSERSQSRKATYCMILCIWHFGKVQTIETLNTWVVAQQLE